MLFTLFGMIFLGVAVVGLLLLITRPFKIKLPRGTLPLAAGAAMFAFVIWNDYTWFTRTSGALPTTIAVGNTYTSRSWLQPWTYLEAPINRFSAVNLTTLQQNPQRPDYVIAEVYLVTRYRPTATTLQLYDCSTPRRASVRAAELSRGQPLPNDLNWVELDRQDALHRAVCSQEVAS